MRTVRPLVVLLVLTGALVAQTTWTVNSGGGAQFTAIQPAIAAATPGDRIEVQGAGPYAGFLLDRGGAVAAVGATVATIDVVGVPAGRRARVAGFTVDQSNAGRTSVRSCAGVVVLDGIVASGSSQTTVAGVPGLEVIDAECVFVASCAFQGHHDATLGAPGVRVSNANVTFASGSATGGVHISSWTATGNTGRSGIDVLGGHVNLRGVFACGGPAT